MKKTRNTWIFALVTTLLLGAITMSLGATYYVSPTGVDGRSGSIDQPWRTFSYAMGRLQPGDHLVLRDGTYYQSMSVQVSGTAAAPITIRAEHDGKAIVDGQNSRSPLDVIGTEEQPITYVRIQGIVFQNSDKHVISIDHSDHIELYRVSGYNANPDLNVHVFSVYYSENTSLVECVASGTGRVMFDIYESDYTTLRRCWARWVHHDGSGNECYQVYGSNHCIVENCIGTTASSTGGVIGIGTWANHYNKSADGNLLVGNIMYGLSSWGYLVASAKNNITGNRLSNNASIQNGYGICQRGDSDLLIENATIIGTSEQMMTVDAFNYEPKAGDYQLNGFMKNSILQTGSFGFNVNSSAYLGTFSHSFNILNGLTRPYYGTSAGPGEFSQDPGFNTEQYGKGAYLFIPEGSPARNSGENGARMGAEVLYRYENGVLTDEPLWPWPMEDRILTETGVSVTWEHSGGLWRTLDGVYDTPEPTFDFAMSHSGTAVLDPGDSIRIQISADLVSGPPEPVTFALSDLPTGITGMFSPHSGIPTCTTELTLAGETGVEPGRYTITITGSAPHVSRSIEIELLVRSTASDSVWAASTNAAITIDGLLAERAWGKTQFVTFSNPERSDNRVQVYTLWDQNNLYLAYEVEDFNLEATNQSYWQDDGAEIFIDTGNEKTTTMDGNDFHFIVTINNLGTSPELQAATSSTMNRYTMEIAIPWTALNLAPSANMKLGILFCNNDRDNDTNSQFDWLNVVETGSYARPYLWGDIRLADKNDINPPSRPKGLTVGFSQ